MNFLFELLWIFQPKILHHTSWWNLSYPDINQQYNNWLTGSVSLIGTVLAGAIYTWLPQHCAQFSADLKLTFGVKKVKMLKNI